MIKIHNFLKLLQIRFFLLLIILTASSRAFAQTDLRNSLSDLKAKYSAATTDAQRIRLSLAIGNFYFTNKTPTRASRDSVLFYIGKAESLNNISSVNNAAAEIVILKLRVLLRENNISEANKLIAGASGTLYPRLHFLAGSYFLEKPGEDKADLDLAEFHFTTARNYADRLGMPNISLINRVYLYNLMEERGTDEKTCNVVFNKLLEQCRLNHSKEVELKLLTIKAINDINHFNQPDVMRNTIAIAGAAGDKATEIFCRKEIADYNLRVGKLDSAEQQLQTVLKMYREIGYKNLQFTYDLLAATALVRGNMEVGMRYSIATVKTAEETGTDYGINGFYSRLASLCRDLGLKRQSLMWYRKWQQSAMKSEVSFPYTAYSALAADLIAKGKARQVLKTLDSADNIFRFDSNRMFLIPQLKADCYMALKKPDSAEYYNFQIIKNLDNRGIKDYLYYQAYQNQAAFYVGQRDFSKAAPYLETALNAQTGTVRAVDMAILQMFKFKIDSANGKYLSAINHFKASKDISDSIYNHAKIKQTEQLQLQYATAERDHENLSLRNKNNLQQSELEKESLNRKLISTAFLGSVLFIGLMLYLYQAKRKSNILLKTRQDEINQQNIQLMSRQDEINEQNVQLISRQEEINSQNEQLNSLLQEKEWLIKEIHHRVKNNLQIISSLLNTQSSFLGNEQALTAIRDSQNRMQAISIVHQKLYQSEDLSTINLPVYIEELTRSIQDSFKTTQNVTFRIEIADARLDTAQTVPLGLILNEVITNSVKYAFNENQEGTITLNSSIIDNRNYQLVISDNGSGLPDGFELESCTSLGMNLIIGLTEQIGGDFDIRSDNGTVVTVTFPL